MKGLARPLRGLASRPAHKLWAG